MHEIKKYEYKKENLEKLKDYRYGTNWPIVYILENGKEAYIGETVNAFKRANQHYEKANRRKLSNIHIIADDEYNKSATLDIESQLIKHMAGDGKYLLQNANTGLGDTNYFDKEKYQAKFQKLWEDLLKLNIVQKDLIQIKNSDLFKYSPYKSLTSDQLVVVENILQAIKTKSNHSHLITGEPGTGKTIVAIFLIKVLLTKEWARDLKVGLVIPMKSLRSTLKKVFTHVKGLKASMVISPYEVIKEKYDILVVDEGHRLQRRTNLTNYRDFDKINAQLNLDKYNGDQLDWIMKSSKFQIVFYDKNQSVKPSDIRFINNKNNSFQDYKLTSQMRVLGGKDYIEYVQNVFDDKRISRINFYDTTKYEAKLFVNFKEFYTEIINRNNDFGLSRLVAGFAWKWASKKDKDLKYDFEIEGQRLLWNSTNSDWVNSKNAINEVGCIHTIQGYDLNYTGVIIGPEVGYDNDLKKITIYKEKYEDFNGKRSITDPIELEFYIKNIYKTLLTRGIMGTYIYVVDVNLRRYLSEFF